MPHVDIILLNFLLNLDTDVIYLDYAKAFDKNFMPMVSEANY